MGTKERTDSVGPFSDAKGIRSRDPDAWATLFTHLNPLMIRVGMRKGLSFHEAQDNAQNTWIRMLDKITRPDFDLADNPASYITQSTSNGAIDQKRASGRRPSTPTNMQELEQFILNPTQRTPEDEVLDVLYGPLVQRAMDSLPPEFRITFLLRVEVGLSPGEVADYLGVSEGTIKSRLNRARVLLEKALG